MKKHLILLGCLICMVYAQYSVEWSSGGYGYSNIDVDNDGLYELFVIDGNGLKFYNGDYSVCWSIPHITGFDNMGFAIPRDINGDGRIVPINCDNDGSGELVVYYYTAYPTYQCKFRVYDAVTHNLEWESPTLSGYGFVTSIEDLDGDNKAEIILTRYSSSGSNNVDVYCYSGSGIEDHQYTNKLPTTILQNPITASSFPKGQFEIFDLLGRLHQGNIKTGIYFTEHQGKRIKIIVE